MDLSIIVPCFNEEPNILELTERIQSAIDESIDYEIVLVNDGSNDNTQGEIKKISKLHDNIKGINHDRNLGIVAGWQTGLSNAEGKYILTMDADLQYSPDDILTLYNMIKNQSFDLIQGWRKKFDERGVRFLYSRCLSYVLNTLFSTNLNDVKSGFIVYRKPVFQELLKHANEYNYYQNIITVAACRKGYKINQLPVRFRRRNAGESFINNFPLTFIRLTIQDIRKARRDL